MGWVSTDSKSTQKVHIVIIMADSSEKWLLF